MVYTLGESLLDIIFTSIDNIAAKAGGSMLNTAVSLGRRGLEVSMISEIGDDETARIILNFLEKNRVHTKFIKKYYQQSTSVALAFLNEKKKPTYSIHKSYPAIRDLPLPGKFFEEDILAFGSMYSIEAAVRNSLIQALALAKQSNIIRIFDPNIRSHRIDEGSLRNALFENFAFANIIKASDEDLQNIFGKKSNEEYYSEIKKINPGAIVIITLGPEGVVAFNNGIYTKLPALEVELVSTVGAGDAFTAGIIWFLTKNNIKGNQILGMSPSSLDRMLEAGNLFASEVCGSIDNYINGF